MQDDDHYVPDDKILPAAEAVAKLKPDPLFGEVTRDQVLLALGEFGIWPEHSRPDDEEGRSVAGAHQ
jgi:hypothetical protein